MRRIAILIFVALCFVATVGIQAQDIPTKLVPLFGIALENKVSPDGRILVTYENGIVQRDEVFPPYLPIRLYNLENGQPTQTLIGHADYTIDVAFSPDGTQLAALYQTGWLYIWQVSDGEQVARLPIAPGGSRLAWIPGANQIAVATSQPGSIHVWDIDSGAMIAYLTHRYSTVAELREAFADLPDNLSAFTVSPDGDSFAVATYYGNIEIWGMDGEIRTLYSLGLDRPRLPFVFISYVGDGDRLIVLDTADKRVLVIDVETGELVYELAEGNLRTRMLTLTDDGTEAAWYAEDDDGNPHAVIADLTTGATTLLPLPGVEDDRLSRVAGLHYVNEDTRLLFLNQHPADEPSENAAVIIPLP